MFVAALAAERPGFDGLFCSSVKGKPLLQALKVRFLSFPRRGTAHGFGIGRNGRFPAKCAVFVGVVQEAGHCC